MGAVRGPQPARLPRQAERGFVVPKRVVARAGEQRADAAHPIDGRVAPYNRAGITPLVAGGSERTARESRRKTFQGATEARFGRAGPRPRRHAHDRPLQHASAYRPSGGEGGRRIVESRTGRGRRASRRVLRRPFRGHAKSVGLPVRRPVPFGGGAPV